MTTQKEAALERQLAGLKKEVVRLNGHLAERNRQLDAMHWAWCTGGCKTGQHRWTQDELNEELLQIAELGVKRMRMAFQNTQFRAEWALMSQEERQSYMDRNNQTNKGE